MANPAFQGTADETAQVITITVGGTWEANDKAKVTLFDEAGGSLQISTPAGSTVIATICTTLAAALNASTDARFAAVTWAATTTTVTGTADTAGVPIYCSVLATESDDTAADSQTLSVAVTIASSGPNDWNVDANWSTGAKPAAADTAYIDATAASTILYGLYQTTGLTLLSSITLAQLKIEKGHKQIGTLLDALCIKYNFLDYGQDPADGSSTASAQICNLRPGNVAVAGTIYSTRDVGSGGRPPLQIDVDNASATFIVKGSSKVGFATGVSGETSTCGTITTKDTAQVTCGVGLTLTTLNPEGGRTTLNAGATTISYGVGEVIVRGAGDITTVNAGGVFEWDSSGTLATYNGHGSSLGKFWRGTVSDAQIYGKDCRVDASVSGIPRNCTFTNGIDTLAGATSAQVNFGDNVKVSQAAVS
jgi:hypothetical protein